MSDLAQRLCSYADGPYDAPADVLMQAADELKRLRAALTMAESALELGCDALRAQAERYHAEMAGYRPERHQQADDDYKHAETAWQAVCAAMKEAK